ncbi:MAG TPA: hypothetical protein VGM56_14085 [Byssovorax sp.]|jgi:hypothetical protein
MVAARSLAAASLVLALAGCGANAGGATIVIPDTRAVASGTSVTPALPAEPAARAVRVDDFAFEVDTTRGAALVLAADVRGPWLANTPRVAREIQGDFEVRDAIVGKPPDDLARFVGQEVALYDHAKLRCHARVAGLAAVGTLYIPVGESWPGGDKPKDPAELARQVWSMTRQWLVAELDASAACKGAQWGRLASLPPPVFASVVPASPAARARLTAAFRRMPAWTETQRDFEKNRASQPAPASGTWDDTPAVDLVRLPGARTALAVATGNYGGPCEYGAALRGLFHVQGDDVSVVGATPMARDVLLWADFNGDGRLEAVVADDFRGPMTLYTLDGATFTEVRTFSRPQYGCPC